jgi:hypothetical protein
MSLTLLLDLDDTLLDTNLDAFMPAYFQALTQHMAVHVAPSRMQRALIAGVNRPGHVTPDNGLRQFPLSNGHTHAGIVLQSPPIHFFPAKRPTIGCAGQGLIPSVLSLFPRLSIFISRRRTPRIMQRYSVGLAGPRDPS